MLIHIGRLSKMCTLYGNNWIISYILYCCIICLREGSASAYGSYDICTLFIDFLQGYFKTYFNLIYVSYNCAVYLMLCIFINTYLLQKSITIIIIKNDGCK